MTMGTCIKWHVAKAPDFVSQLSVDGFLKFKLLFIIHWAAEYIRVGFQCCRLPWACWPKVQKNVFLVHQPMAIYNIGNLIYDIQQLKAWYIGFRILIIHPKTAEIRLGTTCTMVTIKVVPSLNSAVYGWIFKIQVAICHALSCRIK